MTATAESSTRSTILDAAERTFARRGFAGTTIKQLAAEAGVNTALLYYYFADKETLYREMLTRMLGSLAGALAAQLEAAPSPDEAIRRFIEMQGEIVIVRRPHLPTLLVRELVDHHLERSEEHVAHSVSATFEALCGLIERGQREGLFRRDAHPRFSAISVVSQMAYMAIARPAVGILLGAPGGVSAEVMRDFARHAADFALAALAPPPTGTASRRASAKRAPAKRQKTRGAR